MDRFQCRQNDFDVGKLTCSQNNLQVKWLTFRLEDIEDDDEFVFLCVKRWKDGGRAEDTSELVYA